MRPWLLLDVDGVLLPFGDTVDSVLDVPDPAVISLNRLRVARLAKSFEIHWCSGWDRDTNKLFGGMFDLDLPFCPMSYATMSDPHWKFSSICAYVPDEQPYAFIDDEITQIPDLSARTANAIWVPTHSSKGMTDEHVIQLEKFADAL